MSQERFFKKAVVLLWVITVSSACTTRTAYSSDRTLRYPSSFFFNYANDQFECWIIRRSGSSSTDHVLLSFTQFELEYSSSCAYDYVIVRDGSSSSSSRLGKFCGSSLPRTLVSSGSSLYVSFRSDSSRTFDGFTASYRIINENDPNYDYYLSFNDDVITASNLIGIIVGCAIGGLVLIAILVLCAYCCCCKKSTRPAPARTTMMVVPQPPPTYIHAPPPQVAPVYAVSMQHEPPLAPVYAAP